MCLSGPEPLKHYDFLSKHIYRGAVRKPRLSGPSLHKGFINILLERESFVLECLAISLEAENFIWNGAYRPFSREDGRL